MDTIDQPSTATDDDGTVHVLDGDDTLCGQNAVGWSRVVTPLQMAGRVLFCKDCQDRTGAS